MAKGGRRVRIFSALEVANICGVVNQTAINWIRNGHLKAFTTPGGQYRIYAKDLAAFLDMRGMSASGEVLQVMMENANWNTMLLAADPPLNNSLLTELSGLFPEYTIVQAFDWFDIGRRITEEKPGIILLDAELPGTEISRFISIVKEDSVFGKPFVFLLSTGQRAEAGAYAQADAVFTKPLDLSKFKATLRSIEKQPDAVTA
jgi:excisionase family DNA binding protein